MEPGSKAIKPPLDDNVRFWPNAGSTGQEAEDIALWWPRCGAVCKKMNSSYLITDLEWELEYEE